jgi:hypothetical protein
LWIGPVDSLEAAIDWAQRCPNLEGVESEVEIRPIYEMEDFGENLSPELREQEERLRQQIAQQQA